MALPAMRIWPEEKREGLSNVLSLPRGCRTAADETATGGRVPARGTWHRLRRSDAPSCQSHDSGVNALLRTYPHHAVRIWLHVQDTLDVRPGRRGIAIVGRDACELCECQFLVADLDSRSQDISELVFQCIRKCPWLRVLALVRRGDVATAVQATKQGIAECVEKPVDAAGLRTAVERILGVIGPIRLPAGADLTRTERVVLAGVLQGRTTRAIAMGMHRSSRAVEVHRKHIMQKLHASTLVDLVMLAIDHDMRPTSRREDDRANTSEWA